MNPSPGPRKPSLDETGALLAALPWAPATARQVAEAAAVHGWYPDPPWFTPAVPASREKRR